MAKKSTLLLLIVLLPLMLLVFLYELLTPWRSRKRLAREWEKKLERGA